MKRHHGFTLIELLVALAIIGVLTAIAIPAFNGYITSSRQTVGNTNLKTLKMAEESYYFDHNKYVEGTYDPSGTGTLTSDLGWQPNQDGKKYVYTVTKAPCNDITKCYTITITYGGTTIATESRGP